MKGELAALILYGLVAVIWLFLCFRDLHTAGQVEGVRVACAVVWSVGFFILLGKYHYHNKK